MLLIVSAGGSIDYMLNVIGEPHLSDRSSSHDHIEVSARPAADVTSKCSLLVLICDQVPTFGTSCAS